MLASDPLERPAVLLVEREVRAVSEHVDAGGLREHLADAVDGDARLGERPPRMPARDLQLLPRDADGGGALDLDENRLGSIGERRLQIGTRARNLEDAVRIPTPEMDLDDFLGSFSDQRAAFACRVE